MVNIKRTQIIAEVGVNHNGNINLAKELIEKAALAGADFVKFQSFNAKYLATKHAKKTNYQKKNQPSKNDTQLDLLSSLELSNSDHKVLYKHCIRNGIKFLSTAFDSYNLDMLIDLGISYVKIPSGEINNIPFLRHISRKKLPILLSTGMSKICEIELALNELTQNGLSKSQITLLHCNTEYPTPFIDVNLLAMKTMKDQFSVNVGYSDHTLGIEIPIAAVALGAVVIEKHITIDNNMDGPDHRSSLNVESLGTMIKSIRNVELSIGDGVKKPTQSEIKNSQLVRRSIVAKKKIHKGEYFTEDNITTKRPGTGISCARWDEIIGKKSNKNYFVDDLIIQ